MNMKWIVFSLCLWIAGQAYAGDDYGVRPSPRRTPTEGVFFDKNTGFTYKWKMDKYGDTEARGTHPGGAANYVTIKKNGDMHGFHADGNYWTYDKRTGMYYNFGTDEAIYKGKGK